jgi:WD40 repeat protein
VRSASFSPDGSRIVTGGDDRTAKVWDARTMPLQLELKGHTGQVWWVSFSSDGSRIVTASGDSWSAYDRWSGIAVIENRKGIGSGIMLLGPNIPDSPVDAARLRDTQTAKVWDARTGQELKGERIPSDTRPSPISPDGRSIAHAVGNRVELIAFNPGAEELEYRRFLTRPDPMRDRERYDEAKKIGDEFAARFYFGLLSTRSSRPCSQAW